MTSAITITQLREWCREYDHVAGSYPESRYEGWNVLEYLEHRANGNPSGVIMWTDAPKHWPFEDRAPVDPPRTREIEP